MTSRASRWRSVIGAALLLCSASACTDAQEPLPVRSLTASGDVSYVCRGVDGRGRHLSQCPDYDPGEDGENRLMALVTQTLTDEVALVDLTNGDVVDVDPSSPGFTLLRVGGRPVDIVSTNGGEASFVAVNDLGHHGIFAIPTSCASAPADGETARDLTSWPACSLPGAPGELTLLIDAPNAEGQVRASCDGPYESELPEPVAATRDECQADLRLETRPPGRRKLLVTLPEFGQLAMIDAQELLDREPGSFDACPIETLHTLRVDLPEVTPEQELPPGLDSASCTPARLQYPTSELEFLSEPAGMARLDNTLWVGDQGAPVIHRIDVEDPCAPVEGEPLLPVSLDDPGRVVTTTRVAVTPPLLDGGPFLYAVDEHGSRGSSVMVFDLGATGERTPLVRPGSEFVPFEPPDRIAFSSGVKDIVIASRDEPLADPTTGVATLGTLCDPDPRLDADEPSARYRPTPDRSSGASPFELRGTFAHLLLSDGNVAVIDIEDYDAPCRRPISTNSSGVLDFRGCAEDDTAEVLTLDGSLTGVPTVSAEASCRVVEPHRVRSGRFIETDRTRGVGAPALRTFPRLSLDDRTLVSSQTDEGSLNPKLLAVDFSDPDASQSSPAQLFVGTTLYSRSGSDNLLELDPARAERASVLLPYYEPRAYAQEDRVSITYEGRLGSERLSGLVSVDDSTLFDADAFFCDAGVQGSDLTRQVGADRFGLQGESLDEFAGRYADYVHVVAELPRAAHSYWKTTQGMACGGFSACEAAFGEDDLEEADREFRVTKAFQDHLQVEPKHRSGAAAEQLVRLLDCCFPDGPAYVVRASKQWVVRGTGTGLRHRVVAERRVADDGSVSFPCALDCDPRKRFWESRVFEVAPGAGGVCDYEGPVSRVGEGAECVFSSLTAQFAIYAGEAESQRDMTFSYDVLGGFRGLVVRLTGNTSTVLAERLTVVPGFGDLAAVDSQDQGLMIVNLGSLQVSRTFF